MLLVTEAITWSAIDLLRNANVHGRKYAIDAVVAATALSYRGPRIILTSDADEGPGRSFSVTRPFPSVRAQPVVRGKEISTRRFFLRPASVLLSAIGYCSP